MPASIGVNLRVTGHCSQGGRKYMEDLFSVAYQQTEDERDLEYAFFGIYDGHGGSEAAAFAKEHLMDSIVKQRQFWSDNDEDVLKAIRHGYMLTHLNMWKELEKWPKTVTGLPSTAGTTASVAFIRRGKIYIGHVGDSAIVLGYQKDGCDEWAAKPLTLDHKPESTAEMERIHRCGGKVVSKAGVPRVVWNRPRPGHKGPIKKNTQMDEIPFLAVARSLGDLWSYNSNNDEFIVSPDPDVGVLTIDATKFRCLIFGTDGLWNMISPEGAVSLVQATERHNEAALVSGTGGQPRDWLNPSKSLVDHALERWSNTRMRADNTSVVTLMLDPPGPPRATVLRSRTAARAPPPRAEHPRAAAAAAAAAAPADPVPQNGLAIMTRYSDVAPEAPDRAPLPPLPPCATIDARFSLPPADDEPPANSDAFTNYGNPAESYFMARLINRNSVVNTLSEVFDEIVQCDGEQRETSVERAPPPPPVTSVPEPQPEREPPAADSEPKVDESAATEASPASPSQDDIGIQINEVSSSSPTDGPTRPRGRRSKGDVKQQAASGRVLRSHDSEPPRPATRQTSKGRPQATLERVVILSRARGVSATPAPAARPEPTPEEGRATRSRDSSLTTLAQRIARGVGVVARPALLSGNSTRAPLPARRVGARSARAAPPAPDCSKENCGGTRRRRVAPAAAPPPPGPRTRLRDSRRDDEVHSTTGEACGVGGEPCAPVEPPRALRSRNGDLSPVSKRARCDEPRPLKASKLCVSSGARSLARRGPGPWAPALALRNRLRKRLAK